jgi:hypothetical protein
LFAEKLLCAAAFEQILVDFQVGAMKKILRWCLITVLVLATVLGLILAVKASQPATTPGANLAGRVVVTWLDDDTQAISQNAAGRFSVKAYMANSRFLLFFYTLQSTQARGLQAVATSHKTSATGSEVVSSLKVKRLQTIAKVADLEVGLIEVEPLNLQGQIVVLQVTPKGGTQTWWVAPIKQIAPVQSDSEITYHSVQPDPSSVNIAFGPGNATSYTTLTLSPPAQSKAAIEPGFFKLDKNLNISAISETEYKTINAPLAVDTPNSANTENGYRATVAPTRAS